MGEEGRFEEVERNVQERLLSWIMHRDEVERVLMKKMSRFFLGGKVFKDFLKLHALACEGVKSCLESVESLKRMRRLRYRIFVLERIRRRRRGIHESSNR